MSDFDQLRELIEKYWDIAWCEGRDNRQHDTESHDAQYCLSGIEAILSKLESARAQGGQEVEPVAWIDPDSRSVINRELYEQCPRSVKVGYTLPLYTHPQPAQQGSVPEVCDGKEQEAFEVYASRKGYDMAQHPLHYLFINDKTNAARQAWKAAISYCHEQVATIQPEEWVKCADRLPTEADADFRDDVWVNDKAMSRAKYQQCLARWDTVGQISDYTHWKPTGLKRPQPPQEGE